MTPPDEYGADGGQDFGLDERFADWVDGRLGPEELAALEEELRRDENLRAAAEQYRATVGLLRKELEGGAELVPPADMVSSVLQRVSASPRPRRIMPLVGSLLAAAAMISLVVVLGEMTSSAGFEPDGEVAGVEAGDRVRKDLGSQGEEKPEFETAEPPDLEVGLGIADAQKKGSLELMEKRNETGKAVVDKAKSPGGAKKPADARKPGNVAKVDSTQVVTGSGNFVGSGAAGSPRPKTQGGLGGVAGGFASRSAADSSDKPPTSPIPGARSNKEGAAGETAAGLSKGAGRRKAEDSRLEQRLPDPAKRATSTVAPGSRAPAQGVVTAAPSESLRELALGYLKEVVTLEEVAKRPAPMRGPASVSQGSPAAGRGATKARQERARASTDAGKTAKKSMKSPAASGRPVAMPVSVLVLDLPSATRSPAESATRGRAQTHFFFAQLPLGQSATKRFKSGLVQKIARPASPARSAPTGSTNRYSWRSGDDAYLVQGSAAQVQELFLALKGSVSVYGSGPATDERRRAQNQKELAPPVRMAIRQMPDQGLPGSAPAVGDLRFVLVLRSAAPAPTKRR